VKPSSPTTTPHVPPKPPKPAEPPKPDVRPGNGYGDDNHEHTGPPGQDADQAQEGVPVAQDPQPGSGGASNGDDHQSNEGDEAVGEHGDGDHHGSGAEKGRKP
jgi:hypothetical protein